MRKLEGRLNFGAIENSIPVLEDWLSELSSAVGLKISSSSRSCRFDSYELTTNKTPIKQLKRRTDAATAGHVKNDNKKIVMFSVHLEPVEMKMLRVFADALEELPLCASYNLQI